MENIFHKELKGGKREDCYKGSCTLHVRKSFTQYQMSQGIQVPYLDLCYINIVCLLLDFLQNPIKWPNKSFEHID